VADPAVTDSLWRKNNAARLIAQRGHVSRESIGQFLAKPITRLPEGSADGLA
jgi:hypothetical protein